MLLRWSSAIRHSGGALCRLFMLCWALATNIASAQVSTSPSPGDRPASVDQLMARGIQSREVGRDAEALQFYRQAVALEPDNPRVLAHLGATYHALGRWISAHQYLVQALRYRDDPYIRRHVDELEQSLSTVADHVGFLEVNGAPDGSEAILNGQVVATLPMNAPATVTVGSYLLEVRLKGHYTLGRPITIAPRVLTREEVELAPHRSEPGSEPSNAGATPSTSDGAASRAPVRPDASDAVTAEGPRFWPWVLGGLSVAAAATSVVAWERREHYADRWNDDSACLAVGISRQERCGLDLERGRRAETVSWISGAAAGLFAGGAVLSILLSSSDEPGTSASLRCVPGAGGAACFGSF
jgi:hypothetical protein